jgi:hypothetical protein
MMTTVVYFWSVRRRAIPAAFFRMALDRRPLKKSHGVEFAKLLGCGKGESFTPNDADPRRWGILITIDDQKLDAFDHSRLIERWRKKARSEFRVVLDGISAHGKWSGHSPFAISAPKDFAGPIVAITRARISWRQTLRFWRAVPPVTKSLHNSPGLVHAIGIGEAPIGLQGTFSLWESAAAVRAFAYQGAAHREAIAATARHQWYSEELFARFAVRESRGTLT